MLEKHSGWRAVPELAVFTSGSSAKASLDDLETRTVWEGR